MVLPAYNEAFRIVRGVTAVHEHLAAAGVVFELIVVDDGSTDGTAREVAALRDRFPNLRLLALPENRGKGAAVRAGVLSSSGDLVLFTDVDQSTPIGAWRDLRTAIAAGHDVAIGSREVAGALRIVPQPWPRRAMGFVFMLLRKAIVADAFTDTQCGFKMFTRRAADAIFRRARLDSFCFDVELIVIAVHLGLSVVELPVCWTNDPTSSVRPVRVFGHMLRDLRRIRCNRSHGLYD